jgi:hypothetical protein
LHGLTILQFERGSQNLVSPRQVLQASVQRQLIERPRQKQSHGQVVSGAGRFDLMEQPQAMLRGGHRIDQRLGGAAAQ